MGKKEDELDRSLLELLRQLLHGGRAWCFTGRVSLEDAMVGFVAGQLASQAFEDLGERVTPKRAIRIVRREFERRGRGPRAVPPPAAQPQPLPPGEEDESRSRAHQSFFHIKAAAPAGKASER
jgi:hypothetical protein